MTWQRGIKNTKMQKRFRGKKWGSSMVELNEEIGGQTSKAAGHEIVDDSEQHKETQHQYAVGG